MNINQKLLAYTSRMPCKQINLDGPYLQRFYADTSTCGSYDYWLHRFLSADGDRELHNHPWIADSVVLTGSYIERRNDGYFMRTAIDDPIEEFLSIMGGAGHPQSHRVSVDTWHQIITVAPETWTLLTVHGSRVDSWQKGTETIPASPRDWWRSYGCRGENVGDVL